MSEIGSSGFVCKSSLRDFFLLTDKWIDQLGPPDKEAPNPHYRSASPMKLWGLPRVEKFIESHKGGKAFDTMQARRRETLANATVNREKRDRLRANKVRQQRVELEEWAASCTITLRPIPPNLLRALRRSPYISGFITRRDAVNLVRHECSNYHYLLDEYTETLNKAGNFAYLLGWEVYEIIKARVNALALSKLRQHPEFVQLPEGLVE